VYMALAMLVAAGGGDASRALAAAEAELAALAPEPKGKVGHNAYLYVCIIVIVYVCVRACGRPGHKAALGSQGAACVSGAYSCLSSTSRVALMHFVAGCAFLRPLWALSVCKPCTPYGP